MGTVYVDMMSQPARAIVIFIRMNKLPVEEKLVSIGKGQNRQAEYLAVNPLGKIPCYKEGDWVLPESASILRYLVRCHQHSIADHWYPDEAKAQAKVDAAMDWHHGNVRQGCTLLIWNRVIAPHNKWPSNETLAKRGAVVLRQSLQGLESYWLADTKFVAGTAVSIADLLICTELSMLRMLDGAQEGDDMETWLLPYSRVAAWMAAVREATLPVYDDVHAHMYKAAARFKERKGSLSRPSKL